MHGYPHFSFWIPITLAKIYFFPIVKTFGKTHLYQEAPSLTTLQSNSNTVQSDYISPHPIKFSIQNKRFNLGDRALHLVSCLQF